MKNLILSATFILLLSPFVKAATSADTLKFDQRFSRCEKKWVVLNKADTAKSYMYGYIYIDEIAGFTFDLKGHFTIDRSGKYIGDTSSMKYNTIKYRISPNWNNVAILPPSHFKELNIKKEPDWVKIYYTYKDTVAHNYRLGWVYNDINDSEMALDYLLPAYQQNPNFKGLEFEISFAYNALKRYDEAIKFLEGVHKARPDDILTYRELGYAYLEKGEPAKAIPYYKDGIEKCNDKQLANKAEMAINLAKCYERLNNKEEAKTWGTKAKQWAPEGSTIQKLIVQSGY
ncbi:hypothetical protein GCM10023149_39310 [Mucilaginibacter gynuensis]|uniref:Tetratricopeptide repeat protein n=1 Tax=Mucilaginibacter gynuensis TaxID=1302236 RepID=A0ABP8H1I0_9SPHI